MDSRPAVEFASGQSSIKGEDFILVKPQMFTASFTEDPFVGIGNLHISDSASSQPGSLQESAELSDSKRRLSLKANGNSERLQGPASFGLFCIMDGHNGKAAAQHLNTHLASSLQERLPPGAAPAEHSKAYTSWCHDIQKAVVSSFTDLNEDFACRGELAGTTATVVLQHNWLLTVANLGDSKALLDVGNAHHDLSDDHRISTHQGDRRRLEAMGARIAPIDTSGRGPASKDGVGYGPLRVWPGGSCLSRGIGDFDIGSPIIACPYISQVRVPETGGRLIVASDGVWDGFEDIRKFVKISRLYNCQTVPEKIISCVKNAYGGLRDDTSLVVLDVMPPGVSFSEMALQNKKPKLVRTLKSQRSSSSGCLCFSGSNELVKDDDYSTTSQKPAQPAQFLCQVDVAEAVGLMTTQKLSTSKSYPSWCTSDFCETVRDSQEAACKAWQEASSIRKTGKTPSRQDLESFFSAVHHVKLLEDPGRRAADVTTRPDPIEEQRRLDITTRPRSLSLDRQTAQENGHLNEMSGRLSIGGDRKSLEGSQNASTHFREHVGQPSTYPRKFGLYNSHMFGDLGADSGTEGDDSQRNGSSLSLQLSSPFGTPKKGFLDEDDEIGDSGDSFLRKRRSHGSFESTSSGLPTVEEETPTRSQKLLDIVNECHKFTPESSSPEGTELAVRGGMNRFTRAGSGVMEGAGSPSSLKSPNGRPPLPMQKSISG